MECAQTHPLDGMAAGLEFRGPSRAMSSDQYNQMMRWSNLLARPAPSARHSVRPPPTVTGKSLKKAARERRHDPVRRTGAPGIKTRRAKIGGEPSFVHASPAGAHTVQKNSNEESSGPHSKKPGPREAG